MDSEDRTVIQAETLLECYNGCLKKYHPEVHRQLMDTPIYDVRTRSSQALGYKVAEFLEPDYSVETLEAHRKAMNKKHPSLGWDKPWTEGIKGVKQ
jgi:hypothetical protein